MHPLILLFYFKFFIFFFLYFYVLLFYIYFLIRFLYYFLFYLYFFIRYSMIFSHNFQTKLCNQTISYTKIEMILIVNLFYFYSVHRILIIIFTTWCIEWQIYKIYAINIKINLISVSWSVPSLSLSKRKREGIDIVLKNLICIFL